MNLRAPAFTLLELLISAGLLAGLSVLLVFSLSGMINAYAQNTAVSKSNVQGELALHQIEDTVRKSVSFQVLRDNVHPDSPDSQLFIKSQHRDPQGIALQDQYDLQLYCVQKGSGRLLLFRQDNVALADIVVLPLPTYSDCSDSSLRLFVPTLPVITAINITDVDLKVIAFDVRQVGVAKYTSAMPKDAIPAAPVTALSAFPALRIMLATRYDASARGSERAGRLLTDLPPQLLNETVIPGSQSVGAIENSVENGL